MLSFAPYLYRNVGVQRGGPIQRTENAGTLDVAGRVETQMNAFLKAELTPGKMRHAVYGNADGTGSSGNPAVARHKAISEALERWAFFAIRNSSKQGCYGFSEDPSSNGMAAFPGLKFQARRAAYYEALERWALVGWWAGHFDVTSLESSGSNPMAGIRIRHGQSGEVVVLYRKTDSGFYSYGHAGAGTLRQAISKAAVEMARSEFVLSRHRAKGILGGISNFMERRAVYFSTEEGFSEFSVRRKRLAEKAPPVWKTLFDGEIRGPWSRWTTVWRHCVEMPTLAFLNKECTFFFW